ncbi:MAG: respiratory nitrate reductase subunit gamma [Chloroflexi bacterium]|nr:respiratory nitrate reductase subunit gamma [Chloroflexota bacterium]MCL5108528.1 respiratory nitrate reductase subunit gamma [Chloroflexota bacterium]
MLDLFLYGVFPYVALALALVGGLWRYFRDRFSFSAFSSQLLENRSLFWGSVPWHYGIVILLVGHLIGWLIPAGVAAFNAVPLRLYILEITALGLGLLALVGIAILLYRRAVNPRVRAAGTAMDVVLVVLLLAQAALGVYTAVFVRWGSWWYISNAVPYLNSLLVLNPQIQYATSLPLLTQLHVLNAFLLVAVFPFSRLIHVFTYPITYLWRPYINVIWYRRSRN